MVAEVGLEGIVYFWLLLVGYCQALLLQRAAALWVLAGVS